MRISRIICACACLFGLIQPAWSQKTNGAAGRGILGYLDPTTGAFRPLPQQIPVEGEEAENLAPTTGKFVFSFTITIASTDLGSDTFICSASALVIDTNGIAITETASVKATLSGSKATCTVTIPYSWSLQNANADMVNLGTEVVAVGPSSSGGQPTRTHSQPLSPVKVPANGSTTTFNLSETI
jgi:hypothetical protein